MMIDYIKEMNNSNIYNKEDKLKFVQYLCDLSYKEKNEDDYYRDTNDINLACKVFNFLGKYETEYNKCVEKFSKEEILFILKDMNSVERRRSYYILDKYFKYANNDIGIKILKNIDIIKIEEEPKDFLTFKELKDLVITILDDYDSDNKNYEAALVILMYYGAGTMDLSELTYNDLFDDNALYGKVDECFLPYLKKASEINYFVKGNNNGSTRREKLQGKPNVICKPKSIVNEEQMRNSYYRTAKKVFMRYDEYNRLTVKKLKTSGAIHFFVKECIENNLKLNIDWLYTKNPNMAKYEELALKYGLNYRVLKFKSYKIPHVIREYDEQTTK